MAVDRVQSLVGDLRSYKEAKNKNMLQLGLTAVWGIVS